MEIFVFNVTHSDSDQGLAGLLGVLTVTNGRFSQIYWSILINFSLYASEENVQMCAALICQSGLGLMDLDTLDTQVQINLNINIFMIHRYCPILFTVNMQSSLEARILS